MQTEIDRKAIGQVNDFIALSDELTKTHKDKLVDIYKEYSTFSTEKKNDWGTTFKVNKAHEVIEKVLPRFIGKSPKWIVSGRGADSNAEHVAVIQDYLTYIYDEYAVSEPVRLWVKSMATYGYAFARVVYKSETAMISRAGDKGKDFIVEEVTGEYPTIEPISFTDIYIDPRYTLARDMPAIAEKDVGVRLSDLYKNDKYSNIKELEQIINASYGEDREAFKQEVFALSGIVIAGDETFDQNSVDIIKYYGYFNETDDVKNEKLYEIQVANGLVMIYKEEILQKPFVDIKCFDDPEVYFATGFVEPILELQKELNFKKNSASDYINGALNRSWLWSPLSGINPATLVSRPNNIIATSTTVEEAQRNLQELPHRTLDSAYFQEQNDFERQIQAATFTIDTSNTRGQLALTDTATGARIKFFENNAVIDEVRKHFERGLEQLAYKLLQTTFDNAKDNIVFKKTESEEYWEMNKEVLRNAIQKYSIKIETNSSSFDYMEDRRSEAIAFMNILTQAQQAGAVDEKGLAEGVKDVLETFEKVNPEKYMKQVNVEDFLPQQPGMEGMPQGEGAPQGGMGKIPAPQAKPQGADLVQKVAQGKLLQ